MNLIQQMAVLADRYDNRVGVLDERDHHREMLQRVLERIEVYQGFLSSARSHEERDRWIEEIARAERVRDLEMKLCS